MLGIYVETFGFQLKKQKPKRSRRPETKLEALPYKNRIQIGSKSGKPEAKLDVLGCKIRNRKLNWELETGNWKAESASVV